MPLAQPLTAQPGGAMQADPSAAGASDGDLETVCYYDGTLAGDAPAHRSGCEPRCRLDVHRPPVAQPDRTPRPLMLFIHGGTWRVGDRRSTMFSGRHEALAAQHELVVLSVGYRRTRMPLWIFFGLCAPPVPPSLPRPLPQQRPSPPPSAAWQTLRCCSLASLWSARRSWRC